MNIGLRRAEVCKLDWSDVDLQSGVVLVRQGKRLKDRVVRLGPQSLRALRRRRRDVPHADADPVFVSERGGARLTGSGLRGILVRLGKRAGVRTTAHMLRRSYATMYLRGGGQVVHLSGSSATRRSGRRSSTCEWTMPTCCRRPPSTRLWRASCDDETA